MKTVVVVVVNAAAAAADVSPFLSARSNSGGTNDGIDDMFDACEEDC